MGAENILDEKAEGDQAEQLYQELTQKYMPAWKSKHRARGWQQACVIHWCPEGSCCLCRVSLLQQQEEWQNC